MQSSAPSRKRAGAGNTPNNGHDQETYNIPQANITPLGLDGNFGDWSQNGQYTDILNSYPTDQGFLDALNTSYLPESAENSVQPDVHAGQLVRRNTNQQLTRQPRVVWESGLDNHGAEVDVWDEDEDELEARAVEAKKEAIAKKRQIPPFVQKISRYVSESCKMIVQANMHQFSRRVTEQ